MRFVDVDHDLDSSMDAWEGLYRKVYRGRLADLFDFNSLSDAGTSPSCRRYYAALDRSKHPDLIERFGKFMIAGDCDFNFNRRKVPIFEKLLSIEDRGFLADCARHHHDFRNFTLMPINGAMNNAKGTMRCDGDVSALDRPDVFVSELANYYAGRPSKALGRCIDKYRSGLEWYLNLFDGVFDYCATIYLIDDAAFVERLIESGRRPIHDRDSARSYMLLAWNYWQMKEKKLANFGVELT